MYCIAFELNVAMDLPMITRNVCVVCDYLSSPDDLKFFLGLLVELADLVDLRCSSGPLNIDPIL